MKNSFRRVLSALLCCLLLLAGIPAALAEDVAAEPIDLAIEDVELDLSALIDEGEIAPEEAPEETFEVFLDESCTHPNAEHEEGRYDIRDVKAVDERTHSLTACPGEWDWCPDCGETFNKVIGERVTFTDTHEFEDGVCFVCGYKNTCKHQNVEHDYWYEDCTDFVSVDEKHHSYTGVRYDYDRCLDCGERINEKRGARETITGEHYFRDGVCEECGYENTCTHPEAYRYSDYWYEDERDFVAKDNKTHTFTAVRVDYVECKRCGEMLEHTESEPQQYTREHRFEDGVCIECGYRNTCTHPHTEIGHGIEDIQDAECVDGRTHRLTGCEFSEVFCTVCGEVIERNVEPRKEIIEEHWYENGVCGLCGYVNTCAHNGEKETWWYYEDRTDVKKVDDIKHSFTAVRVDVTECALCNEEISRVESAPKTYTENHYFEITGECEVCGAKNPCKHPEGARSNSVEFQGSMTYTSIDNKQHKVKGKGYETVYCEDCGQLLSVSKELKDCQTTWSHWYNADGVCNECGHKNTCKHPKKQTSFYFNEDTVGLSIKDIPGDDVYHSVTGDCVEYERCPDCDMVISHNEIGVATRKMSHDFVNGVCTVCGHTLNAEPIALTGKATKNVDVGARLAVSVAEGIKAVKTSSAKVATADNSGLVVAVAEGKATITVTNQKNKKFVLTLVVTDPTKPTGVTIQHDGKADAKGVVELPFGGVLNLTARLAPETAVDDTLQWKSSNAKIATVENGVVKPVGTKEGTVTITATTYNGKKATVKVKVYDPYKPEKITLDKTGTVTLNMGQPLTLKATLNPIT
ncbi:MAG: Ig domain-containing protein, partial [Cutibacterium sp.]|nr:Ig domain-containing protein [Cutibacterium sp.]